MDINNYISSGIIEMYVMGICDAAEKKQLEELRLQYPEIDTAIINFEKQLETVHLANAIIPSNAADKKTLSNLADLNKPQINTEKFTTKIVSIKKWKWIAIAAGVLFIFSSILNFVEYQKNKTLAHRVKTIKQNNSVTLPERDYEVIQNPKITPVGMMGVSPHQICRCTLYWDKSTGKAYVMIHHLANIYGSSVYQLWATVDGKQIPIGIVDENIKDRFIELSNVPDGATAFMITKEAKEASAVPSDDVYVKGRI